MNRIARSTALVLCSVVTACTATAPSSTAQPSADASLPPPGASASPTAAASASPPGSASPPEASQPAPDGQLAYLRDGELIVLSLQTAAETQTGITGVTPVAFVENLSSVIGLQAIVGNPHDLRLVRQPLDGSQAVELAPTVRGAGSRSPDGAWLAFGGDGAPESGLVLVALATGEATQLTADGATAATWSPDNALIAYQRFDPVTVQADLHVVEVATGSTRQLTDDEWEDSPFAWTEDGTSILTTSHRGGDGTRLAMSVWQVDLADGALTQRPDLEEDVVSFDFPAPDGRWTVRVTPQYSLRIVGDGLGTGTRLGDGDSGTHLTWSPDSAWLVWTAFDQAAGTGDLFMVHAPDGQPIQLTRTPAWESHPVWGPARHGF